MFFYFSNPFLHVPLCMSLYWRCMSLYWNMILSFYFSQWKNTQHPLFFSTTQTFIITPSRTRINSRMYVENKFTEVEKNFSKIGASLRKSRINFGKAKDKFQIPKINSQQNKFSNVEINSVHKRSRNGGGGSRGRAWGFPFYA